MNKLYIAQIKILGSDATRYILFCVTEGETLAEVKSTLITALSCEIVECFPANEFVADEFMEVTHA